MWKRGWSYSSTRPWRAARTNPNGTTAASASAGAIPRTLPRLRGRGGFTRTTIPLLWLPRIGRRDEPRSPGRTTFASVVTRGHKDGDPGAEGQPDVGRPPRTRRRDDRGHVLGRPGGAAHAGSAESARAAGRGGAAHSGRAPIRAASEAAPGPTGHALDRPDHR